MSLLDLLQRLPHAEGEHHGEALEEAQREREAGDPTGADLEVLGEDLGAGVPVLVTGDLVSTGVRNR